MQNDQQNQQVNQNNQSIPTFFIPNVPQSVTANIQPTQQILLGPQNTFIQSVRMPPQNISSVSQWTVNNGTLTNNNVNQQIPQSIPHSSRILFSQAAVNADHFIVQNNNRTDLHQTAIGVNQRFIPSHSLVVAQQLPNQIKQFSVSPSQIPIQQHNNGTITQIHRINTPIKPDIVITQLPTNISHDPVNSQTNYDKSGLNNEMNNINPSLAGSRLQNTHSFINHRRLSELVQGLDPHLQLDDDAQEVFNSFLEEFLLHVSEKALEISRLRNSNTIETKDFQYIFEHDWGVFVPGYQNCTEKPKKSVENEIHKLRMALIKKQCKK